MWFSGKRYVGLYTKRGNSARSAPVSDPRTEFCGTLRESRAGVSYGKILIADDNLQITNILVEYAKREGHSCCVARDGEEALALFRRQERDIDMVLLDIMMPKLDGLEVCRAIRRRSLVPIILITARGEDSDKILGLDTGADDYLVKPFSPAEVMARIRAILRRVPGRRTGPHHTDGQPVHRHRQLPGPHRRAGSAPDKTGKGTALAPGLEADESFSRDNLLDSLWGCDYYGDSRTVDSHIKRLRAKLEDYPHPLWRIKTIWGVGYRFEQEPQAGALPPQA